MFFDGKKPADGYISMIVIFKREKYLNKRVLNRDNCFATMKLILYEFDCAYQKWRVVMRLEQLHYILEIEKNKSIKKASNNLFITQQSLSQSVKNLEKELDLELFIRSQNGVLPTNEGQAVLEFAKAVVREEEILRTRLNILSSEKELRNLEGYLNIYSFGIYDYTILPNLLKLYRQKCPNVNVRIYPADFLVLEEAFVEEYDNNSIGLVVVPDLENADYCEYFKKSGLIFYPIRKSQYYCCCSKNNELRKKKSVPLQSVVNYPMIYYGSNTFRSGGIYEIMRYYGYSDVKMCLETLSINVWLSTIASGTYVGFLHEYIFENIRHLNYAEIENIAIVSLQEKFENVLGYVVKADCSATVKKFIELLLERW